MYDRNRRKFGQNFLVDASVCDEIARDVDPRPDGTIIEIGPGAGAITGRLAAAGRLVAVEIDPKWAEKLPRAMPPGANLVVVNQDALLVDLEPFLEPHPGRLAPVLCGNLPYNRAAPILLRFVPSIARFRHMVFMVQYEVAKRICAEPGSRDYGSLTVFIQNFAHAEPLLKIGPDAFRPRPKVHSGTFRLTALPRPICPDPRFSWFVRQVFLHKRKTLHNALRLAFPGTDFAPAFEKLSIPALQRPEEIDPAGYARLFDALAPEIGRFFPLPGDAGDADLHED